MAVHSLQYGSYVFPPTFTYSDVSGKRALTATKSVHADGAVVPVAYLSERTVEVHGTFIRQIGGTPLSDLRDALRAALAVQSANLFLTTDRYLRNARVDDAPETSQPTWMERIMDVRIRFTAGDPYFYETATQTDNTNALTTSPGTVTISTVGGNAPALPQLSLTVAGAGSVALLSTLTNTTTGDVFTLGGTVMGGQVIIVDSLAQTVTIGGVDRMDLFDGVFPRLALGSNSFTVAWSSGGYTNMAAAWNNRWF
jgi:hypothetical protein